MSEVARQYNILSETLRKGIGSMQDMQIASGAQDIEAKKMELLGAQQERQYNDPRNQLARQTAQEELDHQNWLDNTFVTERNIATMSGANTPSQQRHYLKNILPTVLEQRGWYSREDGTIWDDRGTADTLGDMPVTQRKLHDKTSVAIIGANSYAKPMMQGMADDYTQAIEQLRQSQANPATALSPVEYNKQVTALGGDLKDIQKQLADIDAHPVKYARQNLLHTWNLVADSDLPDTQKNLYYKEAFLHLEKAYEKKFAKENIKRSDYRDVNVYKDGKLYGTLPFLKGQPTLEDDFMRKHGLSFGKDQQYSPKQKLDDLRTFYRSQARLVLDANTDMVTKQLQPEGQKKLDIVERQHRTERQRVNRGAPSAYELGEQLDSYGYYEGEIIEGKDGKEYEYVGEDRWKPLDGTGSRKRTRKGFKDLRDDSRGL